MYSRMGVPLLGVLALAACTPKQSVPEGTVVVEDQAALIAGVNAEGATREITVDSDALIVAFAEENLTDVRLRIAAIGSNKDSIAPVVVENHLGGAGTEVAVFDAPRGSRVMVTLAAPYGAAQPGKIHLRVQQFSHAAERDPKFAASLKAYRAWTAATNADLRINTAKNVVPSLKNAIDALAGTPDGAALAAEARLIRARQLEYFKIDAAEARAEARRAAAAFARLAPPDALNEARAWYVEALALAAMSGDPASKDPSAAEATKLAREALQALSAPESALGPIERARAIDILGQLDASEMQADAANKHFGEALALYESAGYTDGVREMRISLATVLVEQGRFNEAGRAFDELLPQLGQVADPELRVKAYLAAGRALTFSNRKDEGSEILLKALPMAREYGLRDLEAVALQGLGYVYQNLGDMLQASTFLEEALDIAREGKDPAEYVTALAAAGSAARASGDLTRAFKLHEEAVRLAPSPVLQVRTRLDLGVDHFRNENVPEAIRVFREALAIDLHDPHSHVYTDGKLGLAFFLIGSDKSTAQDLDEADRLLTESMDISIKVKDPWRIIYTTRVRAELDARRGKVAAAVKGFERVFAMGRDYRLGSGSIESRSTMLQDEQLALQGYLEIALASLAKQPPGVLRPVSTAELASVRRLETARLESFDALRVTRLDPASSARADALLNDMGRKSVKIAAMIGRQLDTTQARELRTLQLDMARLHAELDLVRASAADQQRAAASKAEVSRAWRPLSPGVAQLSYALAREHVYAIVRSEAGTRAMMLSVPRKELERRLAEIGQLDMRADPARVEGALAAISADLLPANLLPADSNVVEIVAEGRIASVPFAALRSPTDPRRRLVETHDIAMITSMVDVGEAPARPGARPFRLVALASGSGTYRAATFDPAPALQAATKEINTVAALFRASDPAATIKLLSGDAGNSAALRDIWTSGADVVHFATHALADLRQPAASLLVLPASDAEGKATYLTAGQVQAWRGDAGLVFLSACESAIGPPQFAVGMPGLQRAFLRAGARGVIATLAPIEDVLAQEFAADFYARYTQGQSARRALSETQRAWLGPKAGADPLQQMRRRVMALSHAYFSG